MKTKMKLRRTIAFFMAAVTFTAIGFNDIADRANEAFSVNVYAASSASVTGGTVTYTTSTGSAVITKFTGSGSSVVIPSKLGGYNVTGIATGAFMACTAQSIELPATLIKINDRAFAYCSNLKSMIIPSSVTYIGIAAFTNCSSLSSVSLPEGLAGIGNQCFMGCSALQSIVIPSTVTGIGTEAFKKCTSLKKVAFKGDAPTQVGYDPLLNCPSDLIVTYVPGKSGWSSTWYGYTCCPESGSPVVETSTETTTVTATTQTTTQPTTRATTQATTQATTKAPVTESKTEATTAAQKVTEKATETTTFSQGGGNSTPSVKGDADCDGKITAADSAVILQRVLNSSFKMDIEKKTSDYMNYVDVDKDKKLTAADASMVLQKVLNNSFKMNIEK